MTINELIKTYRITSPFGERIHPISLRKEFHNGVDVETPVGTPITAHDDLVVLNVWHDHIGGLQMKVADDKYIYGLAHLSRVPVHINAIVKKGEVFAYTGNTGNSTGAHLHLTLRERATLRLLDPLKHIKILMLFIAMFLFSCSAERHIDKAVMKRSPKFVLEYTISKYGDSYLTRIRDTIIDTIYTQGFKFDTLLIGKVIDTITINKNNAIIKIFKHYDTIYTAVDIKRDTIYRIVYRDRYIAEKQQIEKKNNYSILYIILATVVITLIILTTIAKMK
jgi:hypothetical protein